MIQNLLNFIQPLVSIVFIVAGVLCLITKQWHQAIINLSIANANFWIFYGSRFFSN